jgi:hypothetical protein
MNPHSDFQTYAHDGPPRRLLNANRTTHSVGGRRKRRQRSVAQPLQLLATTADYRSRDQFVMSVKQPLRGLIASRLQYLRAIHQVAEQQRYGTRLTSDHLSIDLAKTPAPNQRSSNAVRLLDANSRIPLANPGLYNREIKQGRQTGWKDALGWYI